jgi:hypothetical protein
MFLLLKFNIFLILNRTKVGGAGATSATTGATSAAKQKKKRKRKSNFIV